MTAPPNPSPERWTAYDADAVTVARSLLGQRLVRLEGGHRLSGIIVETEAYLGADDRAAHTFGGRRTARNESMYLPGGHAYVYFIYGMHYCLNAVCGRAGEGTAVLLRALAPEEGLEIMRTRRPAARRDRELCSGPARLTAALNIDRALDGIDLRTHPQLWIEPAAPVGEGRIRSRPRIGVASAGSWAEKPLRFLIDGCRHVSRP